MQKATAIIFDLGGVILNIDINKTKEAFHKIGFPEIDNLFGLGHADSFFKDHENGRVSDDEFIRKIVEKLGGKVSRQQVIDAWNALLQDFPPSRIEFLKKLKERYRLFLFSNTNGIHQAAFSDLYRAEFGGESMDQLFEKAYYSHAAGFRKPDPEGFMHILQENNLLPGETIFIDDALVNVEAANALGIQGIHLQPGQDIEQLGL
jgi:glucose-1-phosphatase